MWSPALWMRKPGLARSTLSVCEPGPLRPGPFRPAGPPGPCRSLPQMIQSSDVARSQLPVATEWIILEVRLDQPSLCTVPITTHWCGSRVSMEGSPGWKLNIFLRGSSFSACSWESWQSTKFDYLSNNYYPVNQEWFHKVENILCAKATVIPRGFISKECTSSMNQSKIPIQSKIPRRE